MGAFDKSKASSGARGVPLQNLPRMLETLGTPDPDMLGHTLFIDTYSSSSKTSIVQMSEAVSICNEAVKRAGNRPSSNGTSRSASTGALRRKRPVTGASGNFDFSMKKSTSLSSLVGG